MTPKLSLSPSRQGKKQVIVFVDPDLFDLVTKKTDKEGKTKQEILAEGINAFFSAHDKQAPLSLGHSRIVRRRNGVAQVRDNGPSCRQGRRPIMGWFLEKEVAAVKKFAKEVNCPLQKIGEFGLKHITGLETLVDAKAITKETKSRKRSSK